MKIEEHIHAKQREKQMATLSLNTSSLYAMNSADYAIFGTFIWKCLSGIKGKYGLACPSYPIGIYCVEPSERVALHSGQLTFRYEISRDRAAPVSGGMDSVARNRARVDDIKRAFQNILPTLMTSGFGFSRVDVWELDAQKICVEVHGVYRQLPLAGDIMI